MLLDGRLIAIDPSPHKNCVRAYCACDNSASSQPTKQRTTAEHGFPDTTCLTSSPRTPRGSAEAIAGCGAQFLSLSASFHDRHKSVMHSACCNRFFCESVTEKRKRGQNTTQTTAPEAKHASRDNNQQASTSNLLIRFRRSMQYFPVGRNFAANTLRHRSGYCAFQ